MNAELRSAIREIADGGNVRAYSYAALYELWAQGLVQVILTDRGETKYEQIMASGDGPEDLKEMFRI